MDDRFNRLVGASLALAVILLAPGCGAERASAPRQAPVVRVNERDFRIFAPKRLPAGDVRLSVRNQGPADHELIVVRKRGRLPFRSDGLTLDEEALGRDDVGGLEPEEPGNHELRVRLTPGHYVLLCNMAGHYLGGMSTDVVVR